MILLWSLSHKTWVHLCVVIWCALLFMVLLTSLHTHAYFINIPSILDSYLISSFSFLYLLSFESSIFFNHFCPIILLCIKQVTRKLSGHACLEMLGKPTLKDIHYKFCLWLWSILGDIYTFVRSTKCHDKKISKLCTENPIYKYIFRLLLFLKIVIIYLLGWITQGCSDSI